MSSVTFDSNLENKLFVQKKFFLPSIFLPFKEQNKTKMICADLLDFDCDLSFDF